MHTLASLDDPKIDKPTNLAPSNIPERNVRLIALLDSFDDSDPEQQHQDFADLQAGLDNARPGQRRLMNSTNPNYSSDIHPSAHIDLGKAADGIGEEPSASITIEANHLKPYEQLHRETTVTTEEKLRPSCP